MGGELSTSVSRETQDRLTIYADELAVWQRKTNLIGSGTVDDIWSRHIEDCLQVADLVPNGASVVDIGAGAGLPGLIVAIDLAERGGGTVTLVESNGKKCAFLRSAIARLSLPVSISVNVINQRIEAALPQLSNSDVLTARALAPLNDLLEFHQLLSDSNTIALFQKGARWQEEVAAAEKTFRFDHDAIPSRLDASGCILRISNVEKL